MSNKFFQGESYSVDDVGKLLKKNWNYNIAKFKKIFNLNFIQYCRCVFFPFLIIRQFLIFIRQCFDFFPSEMSRGENTYSHRLFVFFTQQLGTSYQFHKRYENGHNFARYQNSIRKALLPGGGVYPHVVQPTLDNYIKNKGWKKMEIRFKNGNDFCFLLLVEIFGLSKS
jgi:hypothetical protein